MNHDWFTKCVVEKLTRDEIVGTAEELEAKKQYKD
jgi:hypothetical protein